MSGGQAKVSVMSGEGARRLTSCAYPQAPDLSYSIDALAACLCANFLSGRTGHPADLAPFRFKRDTSPRGLPAAGMLAGYRKMPRKRPSRHPLAATRPCVLGFSLLSPLRSCLRRGFRSGHVPSESCQDTGQTHHLGPAQYGPQPIPRLPSFLPRPPCAILSIRRPRHRPWKRRQEHQEA